MTLQISAHAIREKGGKAERFSYQRALGSHDVLVRITHRARSRIFIRSSEGRQAGPCAPPDV
jgi:hypothetical protein